MSTAVKIKLETTHGTPDTTSMVSMPINFRARLMQENWTPEEARNAQDVNFATAVQVNHEAWDIDDSPIYVDSIGNILAMALGPVSGGVYKFANDPKSATMQWTQRRGEAPIQGFQSAYNVIDKLSIKFNADGELTFSASGIGMPETTVAVPTFAFSSVVPMAVWRGTCQKAGGAFAKITGGQIDINRNRKPYWVINNTQAPKKMTIGDRTVDFNLDLDFDAMTEYNEWKAAASPSFDLNWVDGSNIFDVLIPKGAYKTAEIDDGGDTPLLKVVGKGLYDSSTASKIAITVGP